MSTATGESLITILTPTHTSGRETSQDRIRVKNQATEANEQLESEGVKTRDRDELLSFVRSLDDDLEFWEHQSSALGLFVAEDGSTKAVGLPGGLDGSFSHVGQNFHMRHLVPSLQTTVLPVLVLTLNRVGLYRLARNDVEPLEADLPASFDDVNWFVDRESQRQQHPDRAGSSRNRHGHEPSAKREEDRNRFLRAVAEAMPPAVKEMPLIVLGDDNLVGSFARIYDNEMLSPENSGIHNLSPQAIFEKSFPMLEAHEQSIRSESIKRALEGLGRNEASTTIEESIALAREGRIATLLLQKGLEPMWGNEESPNDVHEVREEGDVDLLDRLVVLSRSTGAEVVSIEEPIEDHELVALLRY